MKKKALLIGFGTIGQELADRLVQDNWEVPYVVRSDGVYALYTNGISFVEDVDFYAKFCQGVDAVFLSIPTTDDGRIAGNYLQTIVEKNIPVITCEKGALANYFTQFSSRLDLIGYNATVGGGTRLLQYVQEQMGPAVEEVHAVVNGTLNYIFDEVASGRSLGEVVDETIKLGYAEPGAASPLEVLNTEACSDVPMKAAILFNVSGLSGAAMRACDVKEQKLDDADLKQLIKEAQYRRYIVSITKENEEEDVIGGFACQVGEWTISAGFKHVQDNPLFKQLVPRGVNNSLLLYCGKYGRDGTYRVIGPGAGPGPTAASMIKDMQCLVRVQEKG